MIWTWTAIEKRPNKPEIEHSNGQEYQSRRLMLMAIFRGTDHIKEVYSIRIYRDGKLFHEQVLD